MDKKLDEILTAGPLISETLRNELKTALKQLISEAEIKARIDEVDEMICNRHYGESYAGFFTEYANERRANLLKQGKGKSNV